MRRNSAFVWLALWLSSGLANAAPFNSPADRDLIRERQDRVLQEQRQRLQELEQLPGATPQVSAPSPAGQEDCFSITQIRLSGASLMPAARQRELLSPFEGQCLGSSRLNELLKVITQYYIDKGYVTTRAYLPQQDLSDGELEVLVVEGRLEGIDSSAIASERELAMSFPGEVGEPLSLRELEQLVDQLGRLPSRPAQLELLPGKEVGGSRVQLKGEPDKPWRVGLNRHNDGDVSTGEQQWGASLDWDSPLGLADQLSLRGGGDTVSDHWQHSANQSLYYNLPYGWWTFSYSYSQSYYRTLMQLFRPEMFGDTADTAFYKQFVHSGISRSLSAGLTKELQDSGLAMKDGAFDLGKAVLEHPGLVVESVFEAVAGLPQSLRDGLVESGVSIGEGAAVSFDENLTDKLNAIYGTDISGAQTALLAIRTIAAISGAGAAGKAGGKLTKEVAEAVGKKLDEAKAAKLEAEAQAKAREEINARRDDAQQYDHFRKPDSSAPGGEWDWQKQAPNNGAVPGTQQTVTVQPGGVLDRYGQRGGEYMSPAGTPYEARALPPGKRAEPYEQYLVLKPFTVTQEKIAPAFGQAGGGVQMRASIPEVQNRVATINDLIKHGYLKEPKK